MTDVRDTGCLVVQPRGHFAIHGKVLVGMGDYFRMLRERSSQQKNGRHPKSARTASSQLLHDTSSMFAMDKHT